jgi:hypothetical protein
MRFQKLVQVCWLFEQLFEQLFAPLLAPHAGLAFPLHDLDDFPQLSERCLRLWKDEEGLTQEDGLA